MFFVFVAVISSQHAQRENELLKKIPKKEREKIIKQRMKAQKKANKDMWKFAIWVIVICIALMVLFILFLMSLS